MNNDRGDDRGPSPHLSWAELACNDTVRTPYPRLWRNSRAIALAIAFEALRHAAGDQPLIVTSGYRTAAYNRSIRGAPASQHCEGRAIDVRPPAGMTPRQLYDLARGLVPATAIRGIGLYSSFVHIDVRPLDRLIRWEGARAWSEPL